MRKTLGWLLAVAALALLPALAQSPRVGGTLVVAQTVEPDTLDPTLTGGGVFTVAIMRLLSGSLVAIEPITGAYVGYLAESWTTSEDGLTWTFRLKQGVRFHDGTALTAQDWVYTIERAKDPATRAGAVASTVRPIRRAVAVDAYTLRLELTSPLFPLLNLLATTFLSPVSREAVEKYGREYGRNYVGVGPYRLQEWVPGRRVVLVRNSAFRWGPPFLKPQGPFISRVEFRIVPDQTVMLAGVSAGEIDMAFVATPGDAARFKNNPRFQITELPVAGMLPYLTLNVSRPPFSDVRVRRALQAAVNKEELIRLAAGGIGIPQCGPLTPRVVGYFAGAEALCKYDLERAKALMREAGYSEANPLKLTMKVRQGPEYIRTAQVLQQQLRPAGFDLTLQQMELGSLVADFNALRYEIGVMGINFPEFDSLYGFFYTRGPNNWLGLSDPELDRLLDQTRNLIAPAQRQQAVDAAQRRMIEQAYVVPLYAGVFTHIVGSRVKDVVFGNFADPRFEFWLINAHIQ